MRNIQIHDDLVAIPTELDYSEQAQAALSNYYLPVVEKYLGSEFCSVLKYAIEVALDDTIVAGNRDEVDSCYADIEYKETQLRDISEICDELLKLKSLSASVRKRVDKIQNISSQW